MFLKQELLILMTPGQYYSIFDHEIFIMVIIKMNTVSDIFLFACISRKCRSS